MKKVFLLLALSSLVSHLAFAAKQNQVISCGKNYNGVTVVLAGKNSTFQGHWKSDGSGLKGTDVIKLIGTSKTITPDGKGTGTFAVFETSNFAKSTFLLGIPVEVIGKDSKSFPVWFQQKGKGPQTATSNYLASSKEGLFYLSCKSNLN